MILSKGSSNEIMFILFFHITRTMLAVVAVIIQIEIRHEINRMTDMTELYIVIHGFQRNNDQVYILKRGICVPI